MNAIIWVLFFPLLFMLLFLPPAFAASHQKSGRQSAFTIDADKQFDFAQHHFTTKAYDMAIIEYRRFIYFFPADERVPSAMYRIGISYYSTGRFQEAVESFEKVIHQFGDSDASIKSYFMKSKSLVKLNAYGSALINLHNLIVITDDTNVKDEAYYQIGWIHLNMASWERAAFYFSKISPQNENKYRVSSLNAELDKERFIPRKSPETAGLLSIIPGGGYLYCERYHDALITFLLNGALIYAAFESFDEGHHALGALISFVGFGFYAGNIYGAITSAHKYNRMKTEQFLRRLNERLKVNLLVDIEHQGAGLAFGWVF